MKEGSGEKAKVGMMVILWRRIVIIIAGNNITQRCWPIFHNRKSQGFLIF